MSAKVHWEEVFKDAPVGVYRTGLNGDVLYVNNTGLKVIGYDDLDELKALGSIATYKNPDDRKAFVEKLEKSGRVNNFEVDVIHKSGAVVTVLMSAVLNGEEIHGMFMDVTRLRQTEKNFREADQLNEEVIKGANGGIIVYDLDFKYILWNPYMEELTGLAAEKVLGKSPPQLFPHVKEHSLDKLFKRVLNGETIITPDMFFNVPETGKSGWISIRCAPHMNGDGNIVGAVALVRDITDRKKAEEKLQFLNQVAEQIRDALITTDLDFKITYVNKAFEGLYGYSREEVIGTSPDIFNADPDRERMQQDIYRAVSQGKTWRGEALNRKKDGSIFHNSMTVFPMVDENGETIAYCGAQRDITDRKKAEEELKRSNKELEQFASIVTHDLREPLRSVNTAIDYLERTCSESITDDAREIMRSASEGTARMDRLILDLFEYARLSAKKPELRAVDCENTLANAVVNLSEAIKEAGAKVDSDQLPVIMGDESQVLQLFQNLLANAIKFRDDAPPRIHVSAKQEGRMWRIAVSDNGIGINPKLTHMVFEVFRQLHPKDKFPGTGIGLAICKKIVQRHGGEIGIESEPGQGTTVFFTLPVKK